MNIALVGNQNCGKTTLFNALTGSNQKVGNWAGVTVEKKTGIIKNTNYTLIDLPGIYSLTPYTIEETITRNYILNDKPDVIINLVDSGVLERSLYLTTQLIQQNCFVILALNMCDNLLKNGQTLNEKELSKQLGIPCVKIDALSGKNLQELINLINIKPKITSNVNIYPTEIENVLNKITNYSNPKISKFCACEILEHYNVTYNDINNNVENKEHNTQNNINCNSKNVTNKKLKNFFIFKNFFNKNNKSKQKNKNLASPSTEINLPYFDYAIINNDISSITKNKKEDIIPLLANLRYEFIGKILSSCIKNSVPSKKISKTEKLDKVFLNKFLAIPIFALIMAAVYFLSVGVIGKYTGGIISNLLNKFSTFIESNLIALNASPIIISLICNGIIAGVGSVLTFLPQLIILFLCIALLETTGYISRISFILDNLFCKIGLSGKSLIPFIVGTGCSVPAIMATRTIENSTEKETAVILTPFVPCSAKLPLISLFTGYFFANSWLITCFVYLICIVLIITCAFVFQKQIFKKQNNTLIFELPEYKKPSFKYVARDVFSKTTSFIKRAGTTILICSCIVWFLVSFNYRLQFGVDVSSSILASIGNLFSWVFYPILNTFSWGATVSALQGLIAKEQVISSMSVIAGVSTGVSNANLIFGSNSIFSFFTPVTAFSFLIFNLFSAPCFSAIIAMRKELGSTKQTLFAICFQTLVALILASLVTFFGNIFTKLSLINIILVILLILFFIIILFKIINNLKKKKFNCKICPNKENCKK